MGRKSDYTEELAEQICEQVAEGVSVKCICALPGMPAAGTVWRWLTENKEFEQKFFAAKRACIPPMEQELDDITSEAIEFAKNADPKEVAVSAVVNAYNNRAQHVKWKMATLYRERYGDKVQAELSGPNGKPIEAAITVQFVGSNAGPGNS